MTSVPPECGVTHKECERAFPAWSDSLASELSCEVPVCVHERPLILGPLVRRGPLGCDPAEVIPQFGERSRRWQEAVLERSTAGCSGGVKPSHAAGLWKLCCVRYAQLAHQLLFRRYRPRPVNFTSRQDHS